MRKPPEMTFSWDDLDRAEGERLVPVGTGFTTEEYGVHKGLRRVAAQMRIRALLAAGKIQLLGRRRRLDSVGRPQYIPVYGVVKK